MCSIFETLNRTGVRLTVFELLAARCYAQELNLRDLWDSTQQQFPLIDEYRIDPYYVLQSVARRKSNSTKRGDVLRLDRNDIERHWESVVRGYEEALRMLREECGVLTPKWLPYHYLLVPLGAVWHDVAVPGPGAAGNRQRVQRWFWCSAFSQTYEAAANSQAARDFTELRRWLAGGEPPQPVADFAFDPGRLREVTPKQQSIYRASIALLLRNGARDFHRGNPLTPAGIAADDVDDHHIFPRAHLADEGVIGPSVDCVLNRTLIDAATNRRIGRRAPSDYLADMAAEFSNRGHPELLEDILSPHTLPVGSTSPLMRDEFHALLAWRERELAQTIRHVTGSVAPVQAVSDVA